MQFEEQIDINAPAEKVFHLYADVGNWSSWDPDIRDSSIDGDFISEAKGMLQPTKGPKTDILFTIVVTDCSFTVESRLPFCVMQFEHELSGDSFHTRAVHRVTFRVIARPFVWKTYRFANSKRTATYPSGTETGCRTELESRNE